MATYQDIIRYFDQFGILDFLLPFALVFTITFAILQKSKIFGDPNNDGSKVPTFNTIIAFVLGILFVVPHMLGRYPPNYDPVLILNSALPSISLLAIAMVMSLFLIGIFGRKYHDNFLPIVGIISILFVIYIFASSLGVILGPWDLFSWWTPEITELMVIVAVFGLIIWFVTKKPKTERKEGESAWWQTARDGFLTPINKDE